MVDVQTSGEDLVFSVTSAIDLGVNSYVLDGRGYQHIVDGHRELRNFVAGIQDAVETPTHVYKSAYNNRRYQFASRNVTISNGAFMNVIVEINGVQGKVITASPKKSITGTIIWDRETGFYSSYDRDSDIMYMSIGEARDAYADDSGWNERVWFRYFCDDDSPAGVTIFDVKRMEDAHMARVMREAASFLGIDQSDVERRINQALK